MRGKDKVIEQLNGALRGELTAILQFVVHAEVLHSRGHGRLGLFIKKQAIEEMLHARGIIERILSLEGFPRVDVVPTPRIGVSLQAQLENDLAGQMEAVSQCHSAAAICARARDIESRTLLNRIAKDKEEHADYLALHLSMLEGVGTDNYVAQPAQSEQMSIEGITCQSGAD